MADSKENTSYFSLFS